MLKSWQLKALLRPTILILVLDQITKFWISNNAAWHNVHVLPHLNFHLSYNRGAAFGILGTASGWQRWIFIGIAVLISIIILQWTSRLAKKDKIEVLALGLVLGGALGNLLDRVRFGHVVDFIDFYVGSWHWYTFNVADIAICVGAFILAAYTLYARK